MNGARGGSGGEGVGGGEGGGERGWMGLGVVATPPPPVRWAVALPGRRVFFLLSCCAGWWYSRHRRRGGGEVGWGAPTPFVQPLPACAPPAARAACPCLKGRPFFFLCASLPCCPDRLSTLRTVLDDAVTHSPLCGSGGESGRCRHVLVSSQMCFFLFLLLCSSPAVFPLPATPPTGRGPPAASARRVALLNPRRQSGRVGAPSETQGTGGGGGGDGGGRRGGSRGRHVRPRSVGDPRPMPPSLHWAPRFTARRRRSAPPPPPRRTAIVAGNRRTGRRHPYAPLRTAVTAATG